MDWKAEWKPLVVMVAIFVACFFLPVGSERFDGAVNESLALVKWYAREHVLLCLVPAFFIAGAISVFVSQASVMKYLGPKAPKPLAYAVASVSGTILAVCSCTVLPLFAGIWRMGAGLGPATAFLYSGPAINVLAIVLTARILGLELGVARAVGAVVFSIVVGLLMHLIFRKEETQKAQAPPVTEAEEPARPLWKNTVYFASMVGVLVFANWARPQGVSGFWQAVYSVKWVLTGVSLAVLLFALVRWFRRDELAAWCESTWAFAKQILPLLLAGVLVSGLLLGPGRQDPADNRPHEGLIPRTYVEMLVGAKPDTFLDASGLSGGAAEPTLRAVWPVWTNFFASLAGALMYFATLTEVPILQGLIRSGMGKGPALALLLAGPALSLPAMIVLRSIMGMKKMLVYCSLVVVMATITGIMYGAFF
jgi:hypothetical protein